MNKIEHRCLICTQPLKITISWKMIVTKQFSPTICEKCAARFEPSQSATSLYQYNEAMKDYLHQIGRAHV